MTENSTFDTKHTILTSILHITYTKLTTEQRNTHIYNLFKITASTYVTEPKNAKISY